MSKRTLYGNNGGGKLIRDGIPKIMDDKGVRYGCRVATDDEFALALSVKAVEEAVEFFQAEFHAESIPDEKERRQELLDEAADLSQVRLELKESNPFYCDSGLAGLVAIVMSRNEIGPEEVEQVRLERLAARGGFKEKLILEWTESPTDNTVAP